MDKRIEHYQNFLLAHKRVSQHTYQAYCQDLKQFALFLAQVNETLDSATHKTITEFLRALYDQELTARTVTRKISTLKAFYNYLHEMHEMPNIMKNIGFPKTEKKLPQYLSEEEVRALFKVVDADNSVTGKRNRVMLYLLYTTGVRISELVGLRVSDIQFDTGFMLVNGKGDKQRLVPLPQMMRDLLQEYLTTTYQKILKVSDPLHTNNFLFPIKYAGKIKSISRQACWSLLNGLWKKTGSTRSISPHQLRHSLATHMLKQGANLRSLQVLLGHEHIGTVQIYTHVETGYLRTIYDKKHPRSD